MKLVFFPQYITFLMQTFFYLCASLHNLLHDIIVLINSCIVTIYLFIFYLFYYLFIFLRVPRNILITINYFNHYSTICGLFLFCPLQSVKWYNLSKDHMTIMPKLHMGYLFLNTTSSIQKRPSILRE